MLASMSTKVVTTTLTMGGRGEPTLVALHGCHVIDAYLFFGSFKCCLSRFEKGVWETLDVGLVGIVGICA